LFERSERRAGRKSTQQQLKTKRLCWGFELRFFFTLLLLVFAMSIYTEKARKLRKIRIDVCNQAAR